MTSQKPIQKYVLWTAEPVGTPKILRNCGKCGGKSRFVSTDKFRINAQKRTLDVWLIYQCEACGTTWNVDLFSRVKPEELDKALYTAFLANDVETAKKYAFDAAVLGRNRAEVLWSDLEYVIEGEEVHSLEERAEVLLRCRCPAGLRLEGLLAKKLGLSRSQMKRAAECGAIQAESGEALAKCRAKDSVRLLLDGDALRRIRSGEGENSREQNAR